MRKLPMVHGMLPIVDLFFKKLFFYKPLAISYKQKGQSLLEVLTALGVAILVIVGLSALAVYGLRNAQHSKNVETATRIASQSIEQVRTVRDRQTWTNFRNYAFNRCYTVDTANWLLVLQVNCNPIAQSGDFSSFSASTKVDDAPPPSGTSEGRKITVTVTWMDSTGSNQVVNNTILTQWQQ